MTSLLASPIKAQIIADLQSLVTNQTTPLTLAAVIEADLSVENVFSINFAALPCACVGMSSVDSDAESSGENIRTYEYPIFIVLSQDNIQTPHDLEDLRDQILNVFDTDFTLNGAANGAILPATSKPISLSDGTNTYIIFTVNIKAKQLYELGS